MDELKRACLWLLTLQAWSDDPKWMRDSEQELGDLREAVKSPLDSLLLQYKDPLSKRWMRDSGALQLRDWSSAWRERIRLMPHPMAHEYAFVESMLEGLQRMALQPHLHGLRAPQTLAAYSGVVSALSAYQTRLRQTALAQGLDVITPPQVDELTVYFQRVAEAVR